MYIAQARLLPAWHQRHHWRIIAATAYQQHIIIGAPAAVNSARAWQPSRKTSARARIIAASERQRKRNHGMARMRRRCRSIAAAARHMATTANNIVINNGGAWRRSNGEKTQKNSGFGA